MTAQRMTAQDLIRTLPERSATHTDDPNILFEGFVQLDITGPSGCTVYVGFNGERALSVRTRSDVPPVSRILLKDRDFVNLCYGEGEPYSMIERGEIIIQGEIEPITRLQWLLATASDPDIVQEFERLEKEWEHRSLQTVTRLVAKAGEAFDLRAAAADNVPFIRENIFADWAANTWSLDTMSERFGEIAIIHKTTQISLSEYISQIRRGIIANRGPFTVPQPIFDAMGFPSFLDPALCNGRPELYLTARGGVTAAHRDVVDGVLVNIFGVRRFKLFSPDQTRFLYPHANFNSYQLARVDPARPDLLAWPLYASARPLEVAVGPGEMLFVPMGWFHHVTVEEDSFAMRFNLKWGIGHQLS